MKSCSTAYETAPKLSCLDEMRQNVLIRDCVPKIEQIIDDVRSKIEDLKWEDIPIKLGESETAAIVAYTHDLNLDVRDGNLYFELNRMLRQRGAPQRASLIKAWLARGRRGRATWRLSYQVAK